MGSRGNDAVYLPKNAADITLADPEQWASFDTLIRSQPCLNAQRGHVMRRNSCRGGWATLLNAQVSRLFALGRGQSLELTVDLFNALNFFNRNWGVQRTFLLEPADAASVPRTHRLRPGQPARDLQLLSAGPKGPRRRRHPMADAARCAVCILTR